MVAITIQSHIILRSKIRIPGGERYLLAVLDFDLEPGSILASSIASGLGLLLSDARVCYGRQEEEVFLADDLDVDVFVVVLVECGGGKRVAEPEVDGFGFLAQRDSSPGDVFLDIAEEGRVFIAQIVVFCGWCSVCLTGNRMGDNHVSVHILLLPPDSDGGSLLVPRHG